MIHISHTVFFMHSHFPQLMRQQLC